MVSDGKWRGRAVCGLWGDDHLHLVALALFYFGFSVVR
jgi:hypothetical protein